MKYRIVNTDDDLLPYRVERINENSVLGWRKIASFRTVSEGEGIIRRAVERRSKYSMGEVLFEYDEASLVVDRLKRVRSQDSEGVAMAESQNGVMGQSSYHGRIE
jgi:hypothetical protein